MYLSNQLDYNITDKIKELAQDLFNDYYIYNPELNESYITKIQRNKRYSKSFAKRKLQLKTQEAVVSTLAFLIHNSYLRSKKKTKSLLVPLHPQAYSKIDHLKSFNYFPIKIAIDILTIHNMIDIELGEPNVKYKTIEKGKIKYITTNEGKVTSITLKPAQDWRVSYGRNIFDNISIFKDTPSYSSSVKIKKHIYLLDEGEILEEKDQYFSLYNDKNKNLNKINNQMSKKGYPELSYFRLFNEEETKGGRFLSPIQQIKKEHRLKWEIENDYVELDYSSFNINLLYLLMTGKETEKDPYTEVLKHYYIEETNLKVYRKLIKTAMLSCVGAQSREAAIKSIRFLLVKNGLYQDFNEFCMIDNIELKKYYRDKDFEQRKDNLRFNYKHREAIEKEEKEKRKTYVNSINIKEYMFKDFQKEYNKNNLKINHYLFNPEHLLSIIEKVNKPIVNSFYKSISLDCQYIESMCTEKLLLEMVNDNLIPLSIHDCIIIPKEYIKKYTNYMKEVLYNNVIKILLNNTLLYNQFNYINFKNRFKYILNIIKIYNKNITQVYKIATHIFIINIKSIQISKLYKKNLENWIQHPLIY